jgi:hypothetical protein
MQAKHELIRVLEERGLADLAAKAKRGEYSVLGSSYVDSRRTLVRQLEAAGASDLAQRALNGDFEHER